MDKLCPFLFSAADTRALPASCAKEIIEKRCKCLEDLCAWWNEEASACSMVMNQSLMDAITRVEVKMDQDKIERLKEKLQDTRVSKPFFI